MNQSLCKNLRHSSLGSNVFKGYTTFQVGGLYNERDIHVQKIKVQKLILRYITYYLRDLAVYFHKLYLICKVSDSGLNNLYV